MHTYIHAYMHTYIVKVIVPSHTQKQSECATKVHPYTSNKLNKSNVKKVRLQGTSGGST